MATYVNINDTRYTISQVKAMRKNELITHVMGLADEVNRLNTIVRDNESAKAPAKAKAKAPAKAKAKAPAKAKATNWKNVSVDDIHASFKLAGVTQTMQRRATFALNRGDSPENVANFAVGTRQNKRWEKIKAGAVKARA